jgi:sugar O-acyltransferase (sialic acid O-acetyltransferase NeuD family)
MNKNPIIIIGYSGHAWVAIDAFQQAGGQVVGYCEREEKKVNPYKLPFLGSENILKEDQDQAYFVGIGNNTIRKSVMLKMHRRASIIVHPTAVVATLAKVCDGVLVAARAVINPLAMIGRGAIINTGAIVEHECVVENFAHVAPGAVLAGNVRVGALAFIGAGAVVRQGIAIGAGAIVGAGAVVVKDVPPGITVMGNPAKQRAGTL